MPSKLEICAEVSANHLGNFDRAMAIVKAAAAAGADLVKFQTWTPGLMCLDSAYTLDSGPWKGRRLADLYEEAFTPWEWHKPLFDYARSLGLVPFSAPFDPEAADFLETLGVDRYKIASFEIVDLPLIRHVAAKGKPMILSAGMATEAEIHRAAQATGACAVTLLACVSEYPGRPQDTNLDATAAMSEIYWWTDWGLSDHSRGIGVGCAAAARGASYIEKHLTLSRADGGLDAGFSLEPAEFRQLVTECTNARASIGDAGYPLGAKADTRLRRSLWVAEDASKGEPVRFMRNVRTARPATGLPCSTSLTNKRFTRNVKRGEPLTEDMLT